MKVLQKLNITVTHIAHLADVHIRNVKRHAEYEKVFNTLYENLRELKQEHPGLAIYLGGDIVHAKLDMSPELIQVTYKFLKSCADIAPTFMILGNHDCNLNNKHRLDALSPIVNSLDHPNLFFLKDTGVYRTNNIDFVLWSITDDVENYKVPKKGSNQQVLFFHGAVDTAQTEQGIEIKNNKVTLDMMNGFDYVMLGDIHKYQYLDENKRICYCGSTIQQNFGESLSHGFVLWYMSNGFSKFIEIPNDYGFYTLEVRNGKFEDLPKKFAKNPIIRLKAYDTPQSEITKLVTSLKTKVKVEEIKISKITTKSENSVINKIKVGDIRDIEYQNNLIINYLEKTVALDQETKDALSNINRQLNSNIDMGKSIKNITWVPINFEFSNMFSYGENNSLNFKNMSGIYGLFANNAAGKSSVLDALMFCIFDKCSRTFKASQVLNNKKDSFSCKFTFEIHGKEYYIERYGQKDKKGHVKVYVKFYTIENGNEIDLSGQDRDDTNNIIREYLGNYDEFILTTLSIQNNSSNFVDKAQRERKDLLSQFLDLNVFEELTQLATTEANQIKALIKDYAKQDYSTQIADSLEKKKEFNLSAKNLSAAKQDISAQLEDINDKIIQLTGNIKPIDGNVSAIDLTQLSIERDDLVSKSEMCVSKKQSLLETNEITLKKMQSLNLDIEDLDESVLLDNKLIKQNFDDELDILRLKLDRIKLNAVHLQSKIEKLDTHEYDPTCKYCINNEFVRDAENAKKELVDIAKEMKSIENSISDIKLKAEPYNTAVLEYERYKSIESEMLKLKADSMGIDKKIIELESIENKIASALEQISLNEKKYKENEQAILHNKSINSAISDNTLKKQQLNGKLLEVENELLSVTSQIKVYDSIIKNAKDAIFRLQTLENDYKIYDLYTKATNRNGVPYDLISNILPQIENEVNDILSYLADFKIALETDGKSINIYIIYDDEKYWALELASGMEKFVSSIAIRNALINYSNLPRPNFMAIDEGFGVLDSENMSSLYNLFQFLKSQYKFIIIISHIDSLKDMAEKQIDIYKSGEFSKINF